MFSQTLKLAVKSISSMLQGMGVTLHPLVIEWVTHFFTVSSEDKVLPLEASEETKVAVISYLYRLWSSPSWMISHTRVGDDHYWAWFTSLAGVIGAFEFKFEESPGGIKVLCKDKWDFNVPCIMYSPNEDEEEEAQNMSSYLVIPVKGAIKGVIASLASRMGIQVYDEPEVGLGVHEKDLVFLNQKHAFWTRWEFFISWDELEFPDGTGPKSYDWQLGGLPITWVKREALISGLKNLGVNYNIHTEKVYSRLSGQREELPLTWETLNYLRSLPTEELVSSSRRKRF